MNKRTLENIAPGEILATEFLKPMRITLRRLAKDIGVSGPVLSGIINGQCAIDRDTARRLGRYFRTASRFWLNLQSHYDLERQQERNTHERGR